VGLSTVVHALNLKATGNCYTHVKTWESRQCYTEFMSVTAPMYYF